MKLTKEQYDSFVRRLERLGGPGFALKCPLCGRREWGVEGQVLAVAKFHSDAGSSPFWHDDESLPIVCVSCRECGYAFLINAVTAKLIPPPQPGLGGVR